MSSKAADDDTELTKLKIHLIPVGEAPKFSIDKIKLSGKRVVYDVDKLLRAKYNKIQLESEKNFEKDPSTAPLPKIESFYFHISSSFCPTPDQTLQELYDCFATGDELVLQYGVKEAWG